MTLVLHVLSTLPKYCSELITMTIFFSIQYKKYILVKYLKYFTCVYTSYNYNIWEMPAPLTCSFYSSADSIGTTGDKSQ